MPLRRLKQTLLLLLDLFAFDAAVILLAVVRENIRGNEMMFIKWFPLWIVVFYISGLYDIGVLKNDEAFSKKIAGAMGVAMLALLIVVPIKIHVAIFMSIAAPLTILLRMGANWIIGTAKGSVRTLLIGNGEIINAIAEYIDHNPQVGYALGARLEHGLQTKTAEELRAIIQTQQIKLIVIPSIIKKEERSARVIYEQLAAGTGVMDIATLYEKLFEKIPLKETEEVWFLENIVEPETIYAGLITPIERIAAIILAAILAPLMASIAILVRLTSRGPAIYAQRRVGRHGRHFTLYKFRSMQRDAEKNGAQWASENDSRETPFGKILRITHLDELPQLWNIMRGELSFVGPRPERPEFVESLQQQIPFYNLRHLANPGITGWAQVKYRYGRSVEDAHEKLQYDLYYLKHRSPLFDLGIITRTLKLLFIKNV